MEAFKSNMHGGEMLTGGQILFLVVFSVVVFLITLYIMKKIKKKTTEATGKVANLIKDMPLPRVNSFIDNKK